MNRFDLFLDESGDFGEPGSDGPARSFQPQIAGFVARSGKADEASADALLSAAFRCAGQPYPAEVHGTRLRAGLDGWEHLTDWDARKSAYGALIRALVDELQARGLQPIRLVNREGLRLETRAETQCAMTAALVIRAARLLSPDPRATVAIDIHLARVALTAGTRGQRIEADAYADALRRELALGLARHEIPRNRWQTEIVSILPARHSRLLQVADLISHASHDRFSPLDRSSKAALSAALGSYDISLAVPVAIEQAERSLAYGAVGAALQGLAERHAVGHRTATADHAAGGLLEQALIRLAASSPETRDDQLASVVSWIRLLASDMRNAELAIATCRWVVDEIEAPLAERLPDRRGIAWFGVAVRAWLLTAHNHAGQIVEGHAAASEIETRLVDLAGRWEQVPVLLGGLITLAVHAIDCRAFEEAIQKADAVASFFGSLSDLFGAAMPGRFPPNVRSNLRGKALGTALQARLHRGLARAEDIAEARQISDAAIEEFTDLVGRGRQHQYRAFLETLAGDFRAARQHLGLALGVEAEHGAIAAAIARLPTMPRGFLLLHWLRLGAAAHNLAGAEERAAFDAAFEASGFGEDEWCLGQVETFPVQGILLHLSHLTFARGETEEGMKRLRRLVVRCAEPGPSALSFLAVGGLARAAALLLSTQPARALTLLIGAPRKRTTLSWILPAIEPTLAAFPGALPILGDVGAILKDAAAKPVPTEQLRKRLNDLADRMIV